MLSDNTSNTQSYITSTNKENTDILKELENKLNNEKNNKFEENM